MSGQSLLANKINELNVLAERYGRKAGLEKQAQVFEESAKDLRDKHQLPEKNKLIPKFIDFISELDKLRNLDPHEAQRVEEELETSLDLLSEWVKDTVKDITSPIQEKDEVTADSMGSYLIHYAKANDPVQNAIGALVRHRVLQLPVTNGNNNGHVDVIGLLTDDDIFHDKSTLDDFSHKKVLDFLPDNSLDAVGQVFPKASLNEVRGHFDEGKELVLVIDPETKEPLEIITPFDVLRQMDRLINV